MSYRRRRFHGGGQRHYDAGQEAARRHIKEAKDFTAELGGTDQDVKAYFFGLSGSDLDVILSAYGAEFGKSAESYAREALPKWRSGAKKMSGLVAKRLFGFLPARMPLGKKYELAENIWKHFGPSSSHTLTVGPTADVGAVAKLVADKLDGDVTTYSVPENVGNRFKWLSDGDIGIHEQMLNHFRQQEKQLAVSKVTAELPILQRQMCDTSVHTHKASTTIQIHKHTISIHLDKSLGDRVVEGYRGKGGSGSGGTIWIWIAIIVVVLFLMTRGH